MLHLEKGLPDLFTCGLMLMKHDFIKFLYEKHKSLVPSYRYIKILPEKTPFSLKKVKLNRSTVGQTKTDKKNNLNS